uniref:Uncharacterized protein n=1 Tax=Panagrolaimus davidi TaxID=227884 RepID=A0A914PP02_9BILA
MPCLIPEILFGIGKKLIENGNLKTIVKFSFSGKESFNVLKNVFASISTIEIYYNFIGIGWDKEPYIFDVEEFPKSFMYCIGGNVKSLYIEREINPIFQTIIDKIISEKQLISFSAGKGSYFSNTLKMDKFLPIFSSTLKELKIPSRALNEEIIDSLTLQTLSLVNYFHFSLSKLFIKCEKINSPFHASIQTLTFNDKTGILYLVKEKFKFLFQIFSSLKNIHFNMKYDGEIKQDLSALLELVKNAGFSSNIVYTVLSNGMYLDSENDSNLAVCKNICKDFVYDSSNPMFHCFLQTFKAADSQETYLKVLIPKKQKLDSENFVTYVPLIF